MGTFGFLFTLHDMKQRGWDSWRQRRALLTVWVWLSCVISASAQLRYTISEEVKEGSFVGNVAKDLGIDVSVMKRRGFRIMSGLSKPLFNINENDGALYSRQQIDREEVCKDENACLINLKTVLENPLEISYITVEITDLNDHSPAFPEKTERLEISESALPGAKYQLQKAYDPDSGTNSVQQYTVSQNEHFRLEIKDRGKDGKTPILQLQRQLDRETKSSQKLLLKAIDGGTPPKTGTVEIHIDVIDVNDNMPVFINNTYSAILQENAPVGTTVIQVNATDLDTGSNGEVFYSFGSDVKDKVKELFSLNSATGEIIVKGQVDFEEKDSYDIDIQASDKGNVPFKTYKNVIIKIADINDNPPEIEVASLSRTVSEDSRPGTTVALISITDLDSGINGKVMSYIADETVFKLTPSIQDNIFAVVTKSQLDREEKNVYDLTIIAKDAGVPPLMSQKKISLQLSDSNDNSPEFLENVYTFYVPENNPTGSLLCSVQASDRDEGENALITYSLMRTAGNERSMILFVNINSENGDIMALKSFDFETLKTFQFQVVATDSGIPSLSSNVTVKVFILDQNDNAPVILHPISSNGSAEGVEEIPRNVNAGHLVTKVRAYDADIGYNGWLLFSLQEVTDHSLFGLDRYTGQIRTLRSFTETDEAEHKLVILVKDNGNISLSATATVFVKLVEPKEAFAASDVKTAAREDDEDHSTFYLMITLGAVSVLFIISIIVLIAMQCSKSTDYTSKYLQETNYDGTLCHSIQYRSGDKRYMLVGPRMSIGSTIAPGSHANTLVLPDRRTSEGPKAPNSDWRYSASLRAGGVMQSSVHMEESSVMQGAQGVLVQNWPTASSAADGEGGEVSPPMGAGVDSNSWHFRYGPGGPGAPPQHLKPGEVPPEAFIIPGSPAIISIRQNQGGEDDKSDFITFGKKEEAKKKKKKKKEKEKKDKKDKGKDDGDE
ncbi:protocadherin alpha-3-like isoform X4 [Cyprinodon tularosa]|uniref:protocadherin alpha-3-like isoform X4 n=1 Tax=Cyprinodon tularosa TaxID=77115 RepID=UPI0018E1FA4E|nr:protocadherin alpha-3-like isoform X4 [Cyprinodon tularosa]